jgi:exosortase A
VIRREWWPPFGPGTVPARGGDRTVTSVTSGVQAGFGATTKILGLLARPGVVQMRMPAIRAAAVRQDANHAAWAALAILALIVAFNAIDVVALAAQWRTSYTYSHGFLVAALIPWLIWRERGSLAFERRAPTLVALPVLVAVELLWLFAHGAHIDVIRTALLPVIAWSAMFGVLGPNSARRLAFPLAWFWCAVSVWDALAGPLQRLTAVVDRTLLELLGIPALLTGSTIAVPAGTFEVAAACSGLNFLVVAVTIAALVGHLRRWSPPRRIRFVAIMALAAIASNWLRVGLIIAIGQWTQMQTALVREGHYRFGWWLFAAILLLLLYLTDRWDRAAPVAAPRASGPTAPTAAIAGRAAIILAVAAAAPAWGALQDLRSRSAPVQALELPSAVAGWTGPEATPEAAWRPTFIGATARRTAAYRRSDLTLVVDLTYYATQHSGAKLIGFPSNAAGPEGSIVFERRIRTLDSGAGAVHSVNEMIVATGPGRRWRVWQWFQVGASVVARPAELKLREGLVGLTGPVRSAAISVAVACLNECQGDRESAALAGFVHEAGERLLAGATGGLVGAEMSRQ